MRFNQAILWLLAFITLGHAFTIPTTLESVSEASQALFKRKGGGGGGKGGSGSSSSGSSSSGGSSGAGRGSTSSNSGGSTTTGSGAPKSFGGSYAGGASTPYTAGSASRAGVAPYFLGGAALGFFPGLWLYGAYAYPYSHPYSYRNNTSGQNMTVPATCLCEQYSECGCDDNNSTDYQTNVANNQSISKLAIVNSTQTLVINGTLPNGTTSDGGDEDAYGSGAATVFRPLLEMSGSWVVIAGVGYSLWFM